MPPGQAAKLLGTAARRLRRASRTFDTVPGSARYLYPDTERLLSIGYGDGYLYRVDRSSSLISHCCRWRSAATCRAAICPSSYMTANYFVPDYYGFNSFYPASYAGYGYGYDNLCNRYVNGVVYQVDCVTGMIEDVDPALRGRLWRRADAAVGLRLLQRAVPVSQHVLRHARLRLLVRSGRDLSVRPVVRA